MIRLSVFLVALVVLIKGKHIVASPTSVQQNDASTPDLASMLKVLSGSTKLTSLLSFAKELKMLDDVAKQLSNLSPLINKIIVSASRKNAKIRVMMLAAVGKFPDLKDLYNLATYSLHNESIPGAVESAMKSNTQFQEIQLLMRKKGSSVSDSDIQEFVHLFTGKTLDFLSSATVEQNNGGPMMTVTDYKIRNLKNWFSFAKMNWKTLMSLFPLMETAPIDYVKLMLTVAKMDFTDLANIVSVPSVTDGSKYTVVVGSGATTDPDVTKILQDVRDAKALVGEDVQSKALSSGYTV